MHILFISCGDIKYGTIRSLLGLVKGLKVMDASCKVSVVLSKWYHYGDCGAEFEAVGCSTYYVPYMPFCQCVSQNKAKMSVKYPLMGGLYLYGRLTALHSLEKQIDLSTVDLIHTNSSRVDFGGEIAEKYRIPLIWHIREFGDLDFSCYSYRHHYITYMSRTAAVFVAVSNAVREHWILKGLPSDKIRMIYDGVEYFPMEKGRKEKDGAGRFGVNAPFGLVMVGSISETKGQWQIIEAISLLPGQIREKVTLDIVGDGAGRYIKKLKEQAEHLGVAKQIRFLGYQKNFRLDRNRYDCGVMCSRSEGFGRVTAEYMMAGLPVLASDTGANPELVEDKKTGLLYHYPDTENLKNKLLYLIEHRKEAVDMGILAHIRGKKFTEMKNTEAVYQLYQAMIQEGL